MYIIKRIRKFPKNQFQIRESTGEQWREKIFTHNKIKTEE